MAMENPPFMDDFPIESSIYMGFSIAMFDYWRVSTINRFEVTHLFNGQAEREKHQAELKAAEEAGSVAPQGKVCWCSPIEHM